MLYTVNVNRDFLYYYTFQCIQKQATEIRMSTKKLQKQNGNCKEVSAMKNTHVHGCLHINLNCRYNNA